MLDGLAPRVSVTLGVKLVDDDGVSLAVFDGLAPMESEDEGLTVMDVVAVRLAEGFVELLGVFEGLRPKEMEGVGVAEGEGAPSSTAPTTSADSCVCDGQQTVSR